MTCPTCKKPSPKEGNKAYPFCSERCQLVDLGRWLDEEYKIPDSGETPPSTPESNES